MSDNTLTITPAWRRSAFRRRLALLLLTLTPSIASAWLMYTLLPAKEGVTLNIVIAALFAVLFGWIATGFWSAVAGIVVLLRRYDKFTVTSKTPRAALPRDSKTAILFPLYNEEVHRVMEGVRTVWQSLREIGAERHFDIFILSDSTNPENWVNEEDAWHKLCRDENAFKHIFYRHRKINRKGKSGNVADFCRRWGKNYPYMIVFDADSLMSGKTLVRMVETMEARPDVGILQTAPLSIKSRTLISRVQQFSNHLYGPAFAAGLHFWQLGDAQYWGHNAIIRTEPFIRHCHLPILPGRKPLGGPILSHDFVEAALMRRAGYGVWLAYELDGSYEENPPTLIDELIRDRRWCQGNLQHSRLVLAKGFFPTHRALFINGIMSYVSALLWFFFLMASSLQAILSIFIIPDYFPDGPALFPSWPQYFTNWMLALFGGTALLLFLPKALIILFASIQGRAKAFGGAVRVIISALGEVALSTLLAPVRMLYHSLFVVTTLLGFTVRWGTQNRGMEGTSWTQAIRFHWWGAAIGLVWGFFMYVLDPEFFVWLSPIIAGLLISIPLSVWTSRASLGDKLLRWGLFLTPAETTPSPDLIRLEENIATPEAPSPFFIDHDEGFVRAVVIPQVLALHVTLVANKRKNTPEKEAALRALVEKAVAHGPSALSRQEKQRLLVEPNHLAELHHRVWALDNERAKEWGIVG